MRGYDADPRFHSLLTLVLTVLLMTFLIALAIMKRRNDDDPK
jgi:hypothetical protein